MKRARLDDMFKGWFVGAFSPTSFHTDACEVAVRRYNAGDKDLAHFHRVATEITVIVSGKVNMAGETFGAGDIVVIEPNEASDFEALEDSLLVIVKTPGASNDKFMV